VLYLLERGKGENKFQERGEHMRLIFFPCDGKRGGRGKKEGKIYIRFFEKEKPLFRSKE